MIENNPYNSYFTKDQLQKLSTYIDCGVMGAALAMGLANKFELEACNKYLLVDVGVIPLPVSRKFENSNVINFNQVSRQGQDNLI